MQNHDTLVIIRKVGDPHVLTIYDKVDKIQFVGGELHVVLKDGVVHHYPATTYVFELIDSLNYYGGKPLFVYFTDGTSRMFRNVNDVQITHAEGKELSLTVVYELDDHTRTAEIFPYEKVLSYSDIERGNK